MTPPSEHPAPRARPVADVPLDSLVARAEELTRRWVIALILERPLAEIGELPLGDLAREAPALCTQVLRALGSDAELERLLAGGGPSGREDSPPALRLAAIAGARDAAAAVAAAEALRGVLWETLLEELPKPLLARAPAGEIAALADRLAYVCARVLAAALSLPFVADPAVRTGAPRAAPTGGEASGHPFARTAAVVQHAAIVDELAPGVPTGRPPVAPGERSAPPRRPPGGRPPSSDRSPPSASRASAVTEAAVGWEETSPVPPPRYSSEIEIRDARGEEGPAAWIGSIGRQLARFEHDGLPFAVLLLEVLGLERVVRDHPHPGASRLPSELEQAITQLCPRSGSLTRESAGRFWLLAPRTDRVEASRLAERLVRAIGSVRSRAGVALDLAIGTAVCPEHGRDAASLAAQADVELYAARSSVGRPSASLD